VEISGHDKNAVYEAKPHLVMAKFRKACTALRVWLDEMPTTMPPTDSVHLRHSSRGLYEPLA
jgi:hypothetical protein